MQLSPLYASIIGQNCPRNITKCDFLIFSLKNIWSIQKNVVPLHAFSRPVRGKTRETRRPRYPRSPGKSRKTNYY